MQSRLQLMNQISNKLVEQLIYSSDHPAHLKDMSGKYLISNTANNNLFVGNDGVSSVIGLTIWDLNAYMEPLWGNMARDIEKIESNLKATQQVYSKNQYPFLNVHGFVVVQSVKKYPILNANNVVKSILSIGEIITQQMDLFKLFKLYLQFCSNKQSGIQKFLEHLGIFNDFYELPTTREIIILIAKKYHSHPKSIASNLAIETKTVESHLYKIKLKLKRDLNSIVLAMRLNSKEQI